MGHLWKYGPVINSLSGSPPGVVIGDEPSYSKYMDCDALSPGASLRGEAEEERCKTFLHWMQDSGKKKHKKGTGSSTWLSWLAIALVKVCNLKECAPTSGMSEEYKYVIINCIQ